MTNNLTNAFDEAMAFINTQIEIVPEPIIPERKEMLHRCGDGSIVDICGISRKYPKMGDRHLYNTIKVLKAKCKDITALKYIAEAEYRKALYLKEADSRKKLYQSV
jgi:hypothetical protein